ncbi:MAG: hypothetical protein JWR26_3250 [Pedosphaera sp.]|nr:hypothetical protein [Pedosphaera sp.]
MDSRCPTPLFITGGMNTKKSSWCLRTATIGDRKEADLQQPAVARGELWSRVLRDALQKESECQQSGGGWTNRGFGFGGRRARSSCCARGRARSAAGDAGARVFVYGVLSDCHQATQPLQWGRNRGRFQVISGGKRLPIIRLPSASVGFRRVGRGFDFFHGVLADCAKPRVARDTGCHAEGGVMT